MTIFVFRLSTIDVEVLNIELLMYHILKVSCPNYSLPFRIINLGLQMLSSDVYQSQPFDIILDCTSFTSSSEVPLQWLKFCAELVPYDIRMRFETVRILNPNDLMQKCLRRLYNISAGVFLEYQMSN